MHTNTYEHTRNHTVIGSRSYFHITTGVFSKNCENRTAIGRQLSTNILYSYVFVCVRMCSYVFVCVRMCSYGFVRFLMKKMRCFGGIPGIPQFPYVSAVKTLDTIYFASFAPANQSEDQYDDFFGRLLSGVTAIEFCAMIFTDLYWGLAAFVVGVSLMERRRRRMIRLRAARLQMQAVRPRRARRRPQVWVER